MQTWQTLLLALGGLASAVSAIWVVIERVSKKFTNIVNDKIDAKLKSNNEVLNNQFELMLENSMIKQTMEIDLLSKDLNKYKEERLALELKDKETQRHMSQAIIESYKQDIRDIYSKLRETGIIEDKDKAYIDKIFQHYVALGGNSDISAKYDEICQVYSKRTFEKYDEVARTTKKRKTKKVEETEEETNE